MPSENVEAQIRSYIVETFLFGQDPGLKSGDSLLEKGIIDSTGVLELVAFLEPTFGIKVEMDELVPENLDSLAALTGFVTRKAAGSPTSVVR